jgi:hypothetical protein
MQTAHAQDALARSYRAFLTSATGFYIALLARLQAHYNLDDAIVDLTHLSLSGVEYQAPAA